MTIAGHGNLITMPSVFGDLVLTSLHFGAFKLAAAFGNSFVFESQE
jgi:hypothetical protein